MYSAEAGGAPATDGRLIWDIDTRRAPSPATTVLAGAAVALVGNLATNSVEPPDSWRWWPWTVWGVAVLLVGGSMWIEIRRRRAGTAADLDEVVAALLAPIGNGWAREAVRREVTRPAPVRVRWSSTGRPAADRQAVLGDPSAGGWREFPLSGATDAFNKEIVAAFRTLPRRQLVVLGEPGAGKSVFALLLTLGLIRTRVAGEPLPVLVPISDWDPASPLDDFVARRLAADQRTVLSRHSDPVTVAGRLVEQNRVLPVLDGLDELPASAFGAAMTVLDDYAAAGRPLVVTCRTREYERAGHILTTAAVVELEPVGVDAAVAYLSYPETARTRWEPIFAHLRRADADDPLVRSLSTPLMIALARTAYRDPGTDPSELLALGEPARIAGRLMDQFVVAAYPGARQRRWLGTLAFQLYATGSRDLHPGDLDPGLLSARPDRARRLTVIEAAAVAAAAGGVLALLADVTVRWAMVAAALVVTAGANGWLRAMWPDGSAVRGSRERVGWIYGVAGGVLTGFITLYWSAALAAGAVCGFLAMLRMSAARPGLAHALVGGATFAAAAALAGAPVAVVGVTAALLFGGAAGLTAGGWKVIRYRLALIHLGARGRLPWRLRRFLADAHRRGVLRRAGSVHQFRHALLQDHLAEPVRLTVLEARAEAGDMRAMNSLASEQNGTDALLRLMRRNTRQNMVLTQIHRMRMQTERLVELADRGDVDAARVLADRLGERGDTDGLRARADAGEEHAAMRLAELLAERADREGLAARGDAWSTVKLADFARAEGQVAKAIHMLARFAEVPVAGRRLAGILAEGGSVGEATDILQSLARAGDGLAAAQLADLLLRHGWIGELRAVADAGDGFGRDRLGEHLFRERRISELRRRADAGDDRASLWLAAALAADGLEDELRDRWLSGDAAATIRLAQLRAERGDVEAAETMLRPLVDGYDGVAARGLAHILIERGEIETAIGVLRIREDRDSVLLLADLLHAEGRAAEAYWVLSPLSRSGDPEVAARLEGLRRTDQE
jgi:hypothetical protein